MALPLGCVAGQAVPSATAPVERHGERPLAVFASVEQLRARLTAAIDAYVLLRDPSDARAQLRAARRVEARLAPAVRREDARLAREIDAAFDLIDGWMAKGLPPEPVRQRIELLSDQLMTGVLRDLVRLRARTDSAVQAQTLHTTLGTLTRTYAAGVRPPAGSTQRLELEYAYGLMQRAQVLARGDVSEDLGSDKDAVLLLLAELEDGAFPIGPTPAPSPVPPELVSKAVRDISAVLEQRFGAR